MDILMERTLYVYALVCPVTHQVKYVGRTNDMKDRYAEHCRGAEVTKEWIATLDGKAPVLVLLDIIVCPGNEIVRAANDCETKWIKRFRKTIINKRLRDNGPAAWDRLVNH